MSDFRTECTALGVAIVAALGESVSYAQPGGEPFDATVIWDEGDKSPDTAALVTVVSTDFDVSPKKGDEITRLLKTYRVGEPQAEDMGLIRFPVRYLRPA